MEGGGRGSRIEMKTKNENFTVLGHVERVSVIGSYREIQPISAWLPFISWSQNLKKESGVNLHPM